MGTLLSDGSQFDSSRDRPGNFSFKIGRGQVGHSRVTLAPPGRCDPRLRAIISRPHHTTNHPIITPSSVHHHPIPPAHPWQVIQGWDQGVATMQKGEKAELYCRADYGYGADGSPPQIPGGATLKFEVELLSWAAPKEALDVKFKPTHFDADALDAAAEE